jgi:hypothetical protein
MLTFLCTVVFGSVFVKCIQVYVLFNRFPYSIRTGALWLVAQQRKKHISKFTISSSEITLTTHLIPLGQILVGGT